MRAALRHILIPAGATILVALSLFVFLSGGTPPAADEAFAGGPVNCGGSPNPSSADVYPSYDWGSPGDTIEVDITGADIDPSGD